MNCGAELGREVYCPVCGQDVTVQKQAIILSGIYYNQGLEKAQIRDLSGAIDQLRRSLKFNKLNIPARNLLGLVYFEIGEVVSALSEWVISKNIQPEENLASYYIADLKKNAAKLEVINHTIKKFNIALKNSREGNEDIAKIQLKKILAQNPKLIKGYHLLALLMMRDGEYEKARRLLKKAGRIDRTNTTTLRYLKEIDEVTGKPTSTDLRSAFGHGAPDDEEYAESMLAAGDTIQPSSFKETTLAATIFSIVIGIVIGACAILFLVMPARISRINREANDKITEYSSESASKRAEVARLESQLEAANGNIEVGDSEKANLKNTADSNEYLALAYVAYYDGNLDTATSYMSMIDSSLLSENGMDIYNRIYPDIKTKLFAVLKESGMQAYDNKDYAAAVVKLEQARKISEDDYDVLRTLAHAYRDSEDAANADAIFNLIIEKYPDSSKADEARFYLSSNTANQTGDYVPKTDTVSPESAEDESSSEEEYYEDEDYGDYEDEDYE